MESAGSHRGTTPAVENRRSSLLRDGALPLGERSNSGVLYGAVDHRRALRRAVREHRRGARKVADRDSPLKLFGFEQRVVWGANFFEPRTPLPIVPAKPRDSARPFDVPAARCALFVNSSTSALTFLVSELSALSRELLTRFNSMQSPGNAAARPISDACCSRSLL